jgi:hypothetical protein
VRRLCFVLFVVVVTGGTVYGQAGRVSGEVRDEGGKPIGGATVIAENPDVAPTSFTVVTDRKGHFAIIGLRTGTWQFTVTAAGFVGVQGSGRLSGVRPNPTLRFQLRKAEAPVAGVLDDVDLAWLRRTLAEADALGNDGRYADATAAYRTILVKVPQLTALHLQIGRTCRLGGDLACAVREYQGAVDAGASPATALLRLVEIETERGDTTAARSHLDRLLSLAPGSAEATAARAVLERRP